MSVLQASKEGLEIIRSSTYCSNTDHCGKCWYCRLSCRAVWKSMSFLRIALWTAWPHTILTFEGKGKPKCLCFIIVLLVRFCFIAGSIVTIYPVLCMFIVPGVVLSTLFVTHFSMFTSFLQNSAENVKVHIWAWLLVILNKGENHKITTTLLKH